MLKEEAKKGATKLCGYGECLYAFPCGHANKVEDHVLPFVNEAGETMECPLAKYDVESQNVTTVEPVSEIELLALCMNCNHCRTVEDNGSIRNLRDSCIDICLNCPVYIAEHMMS